MDDTRISEIFEFSTFARLCSNTRQMMYPYNFIWNVFSGILRWKNLPKL